MGNKRIITNEVRKPFHHLFAGRSRLHHVVTDTGVRLNKGADPKSRIHQALKTISDHIVFNQHRTYLNGPITVVGGETGRFEIENNDGIIAHEYGVLVKG